MAYKGRYGQLVNRATNYQYTEHPLNHVKLIDIPWFKLLLAVDAQSIIDQRHLHRSAVDLVNNLFEEEGHGR